MPNMIRITKKAILAAAVAAIAVPSQARKLGVGPGKTYAKPSAAAAAAQNGDTVEIDFGSYQSDACTWDADNLVIRGVSFPGSALKYAHMDSKGTYAQGKGIWVIDGKNTTVENIEFSGAAVPDENGAGIRQEGPGVTIRNCYFHDNENGILADGGDMVIEFCEFNHNGLGEVGRTHNIYISSATSFTMRHCYSHHAVIGHNVKSRAMKNYILYNRIMDETSGTGSYDIDLPNGGFSIIMGNVIQQGPETDNPTIVAYGAEGYKNAPNELYFVNNTVVNDRSGGTFLDIAGGATVAKVRNNLFVGPGTPISGTVTDSGGNVTSTSGGLVNRTGFDYRLAANSPAIDKGKDAGTAGGQSLTPAYQYVHPFSRQERVANGILDAGAYEYSINTGIRNGSGRGHGPAKRSGILIGKPGADGFFAGPASGAHSEALFNSLGRDASSQDRPTKGFRP
jgi:hypothetical protein